MNWVSGPSMGMFYLLVSLSIGGIRGRTVHSLSLSFFYACPSCTCCSRVCQVSSPSMAKSASVLVLLRLCHNGVIGDGGVSEGILRL